MARCVNCGRQSIFLRVNAEHLCANCAEAKAAERKEAERKERAEMLIRRTEERRAEERRAEEAALKKWEWYTDLGLIPITYADIAQKNTKDFFSLGMYHMKIGELTCVYRYWRLNVSPINIELFYSIYFAGCQLTPTRCEDGRIILSYKGIDVCELLERQRMVTDWLRNDDTMIFQISSCKAGEEGVAVAFYRNEVKRLATKQNVIIKLTAYASSDKQEAIAYLEDGQKLTIVDDDGDHVYVANYFNGFEIGNLPKKYENMYFDEGFSGIFFDHQEWDEDREKAVPFVKIYL